MATTNMKSVQEINNDNIEVPTNDEKPVLPIVRVDSYKDDHHVKLTWKTWMVILLVTIRPYILLLLTLLNPV